MSNPDRTVSESALRKPGDPRRLGPKTTVRTHDPHAEVLHLVQERVVRRADECPVHLERRGRQAATDDLRRDRIDPRQAAFPS